MTNRGLFVLLLAWVALSLCVLAWCPAAPGSTCATSTAAVTTKPTVAVTKAVIATPFVHKEIVETVIAVPVATYIPIPLYAASYVPAPSLPPAAGAAPSAPAGPSADTRAILEALKTLDTRLQVLERSRPASPGPTPPAPPVPPAKPTDPFNPVPPGEVRAPSPGEIRPAGAALSRGPAVFAGKCASCHTRGKESEGGGFVLLEADGLPARLDPRGALSVAKRSYNGSMPPRKSGIPALSDAEVSEIMTWVETVK